MRSWTKLCDYDEGVLLFCQAGDLKQDPLADPQA